MEYMLMFRETEQELNKRVNPKEAPQYWGAWSAYMEAIRAAGVMVNGNGLEPPHTATVLRVQNGKRQVQDGPFADTREHLGGYIVINVRSLDEALEWAARAPCVAAGSIEMRPTLMQPAAARAAA